MIKKTLIARSFEALVYDKNGASYNTLFSYFYPEFITAFLLYAVPFWIEARWIGQLRSTALYSAMGATSQLIHFIIKVGEGVSIGTISLVGYYNGRKEFEKAGAILRDAFWLTVIVGSFIAFFLYFGSYWICYVYVPEQLVAIGVPYLRVRAFNVFLLYLFLGVISFLRAIKNTWAPMVIFIIGLTVLLPIDYLFIFGGCGLPSYGLLGCAMASIVQYLVMLMCAVVYLCFDEKIKKYKVSLWGINSKSFIRLLQISGPVVIDKAMMAFAYIWLCWMMRPMGITAIATFTVLKDMERFALVPAIASAQVITFLVSNDYGSESWESIKVNIKKIILMASFFVLSILIIFALYSIQIVQFFDKTGDFTDLAVKAFPILSVLVFFDLLQLILSGALRGAANVTTVMTTRVIVIIGYFMPMSYVLSRLPIESLLLRIVLVYASFYIGNALMSVLYVQRFQGQEWKKQAI